MMKLFNKKRSAEEKEKSVDSGGGAEKLYNILKSGYPFGPKPEKKLIENRDAGIEQFKRINETRLELAFECFQEDMKKALYEIIYLLHNNDSSIQEIKYNKVVTDENNTQKKEQVSRNLYVEGAPFGVQNIDSISEKFKIDFLDHCKEVFSNTSLNPVYNPPIVGIYSIGSIGTIGHKKASSDLDLQVEYQIEPFILKYDHWKDHEFERALKLELKFLRKKIALKKGVSLSEIDSKPDLKKKIYQLASEKLRQKYPILTEYFFSDHSDKVDQIVENGQGPEHLKLLRELAQLVRIINLRENLSKYKKQETLLREKIDKIQDYIVDRYPSAEVYLFPFSSSEFKKGHFSSTLDSKESSGSAYELIINYDTLMPGIYFNNVVPVHFLFDEEINNKTSKYDDFLNYIRFDMGSVYTDIQNLVVDQGAAPDIEPEYVAMHKGAVYWEAFKASHGNLPKATLNLLRYEMLLQSELSKTIIQLLKEPQLLDDFISSKSADNLARPGEDPFPTYEILKLEEEFPNLLSDPWWLRYKALKISFGDKENKIGLSDSESRSVSKIVDLAFALHVQLTEVITKPGEEYNAETHRDRVLVKYLEKAFPHGTVFHKKLQSIFVGDTKKVDQFERDLRKIFQSSVERINQKIEKIGIEPDSEKSAEFRIWEHYYQQNFTPAENAIQKSILTHLCVPRTKLRIGYEPNLGWFFKSIQRETSLGRRFDTFQILDHLPNEVVLIENKSFMEGVAHCFVNHYYGKINPNTLKETKTLVEFDHKYMNLGSSLDNDYAYIRPSHLERIFKQLRLFFPETHVDYKYCLEAKRRVNRVFMFLNVFKFGRLSFIYRDTFKSVFYEEIQVNELVEQADTLKKNKDLLINFKSLRESIYGFLKQKELNLDSLKMKIYVNPSSIETSHAAGKDYVKERELSEDFNEILEYIKKKLKGDQKAKQLETESLD